MLAKMKIHLSFILVLFLLASCAHSNRLSQSGSTGAGAEANEASSLYEQAAKYYLSGNFDKAQTLLEQEQQTSRQNAQIDNLLGVIYQKKEQHPQAIDCFTRAIQTDSEFYDSYNNRALSRQVMDDLPGAEADLHEAIRLKPDFGQAHYNLGALLYARGDYPGAMEELNQAVKYSPTDSDAWFQLGLAADRSMQAETAIQAFSRAIEIEKGFDDQSFYFRGILYGEQGSYGEAEEDFDKAIKKGLKNADTLYYRGLMRYYQGKYSQAKEDFLLAIEYQPQHVDAQYYLAYTYARLGDQANARDTAQKALELDPPVEPEQ